MPHLTLSAPLTMMLRVQTSTITFTLFALMSSTAQSQTPSTTGFPAVYVYVSAAPTNTTFEIKGYAASSSGTLSTISGSPFATKGSYMVLNGTWLFDTDGVNIYSFAIESNGALKAGPAVNTQNYAPYGEPFDLVLDHTGQSLYAGDFYIDGANNGYQSWKVFQTTGQVEFLQNLAPFGVQNPNPLSFIGNNVYAYSASCSVRGGPIIYGYKRSSTGQLSALNIQPFIPPTPTPGSQYCPWLAAADTTNHVAISMLPIAPIYTITGPPQIAVYTASSTGNLSTTSTARNMPNTSVVTVSDMKTSPSGKLLAVAGTGGVQVFHLNGANPVTKYTGLLTTSQIDQMFWDNANHLYAISVKAGKLYVWTVTATSVSQAPGSPHTVYHPRNIIVLPK